MSQTKAWSNITLADFLRADPFDQQIYFSEGGSNNNGKLVTDNREFFTQIYSELRGNLEFIDGSLSNRHSEDTERWMNSIKNTNNSIVVFIEGYAGCGKSTFVQYFLSRQLHTYNYEYSYYNYDIGAYNVDKSSNRITGAIRECFINRLKMHILNNEMNIIDRFKVLASQEEMNYLDSENKIFNEFVNTDAFEEAIKYLSSEGDVNTFRSIIYKLIKKFDCSKILAMDCLLRLSLYIENKSGENPVLYICYDNMDSIENFDELQSFDNTLVSLRKNIDEYIMSTKTNYMNLSLPHFVIMATYRKITAARINLSTYSERADDYSEYNQYIQYLDASHLYSYYEIVNKRKEYFSDYIKRRQLEGEALLQELAATNEITKADFVHNRYAGLWNNNYRSCGTILERVFNEYHDEAIECTDFIMKKIDGYDYDEASYYGASAVFLSLICKIFNKGGMWGRNHMNLIDLNVTRENKTSAELTTLSRIMLTYISNTRDNDGKPQPVSTLDIFNEFGDLFSIDDICTCLSNMLARDKTDTWRRPIYYHRFAPKGNEVLKTAFEKQLKARNAGETVNYTELLLCESGYAFVERLTIEFEYFSNRISLNNKSIYLLEDMDEVDTIINNVYNAVRCCCEDLTTFSRIYKEKKKISDDKEFVKLRIHPRTNGGKPQLHTERIIFSHISYLNHCRLYHIDRVVSFEEKKDINSMFVKYIMKYLQLYYDYVAKIHNARKSVADELGSIAKRVNKEISKVDGNTDKMFQSISLSRRSSK